MTTRGYLSGRCSACGCQAEKSPVSARWWHLGPVCPQTSMLEFQVVRWDEKSTISPTNATEQPARFVEGDALW